MNPYERYFEKFGEPPPMMYLDGLSDEERDARIAAAVDAGVPIDPTEYEGQFDLGDAVL